ncbi:hypothetical protein SARC_11173 [Sphaeroforma arctica JP610]|uniref:Phosphatidylinositol-glycan biosynthesis class W protein n=1 Tax=Sphaeroforma arctica JP610 TaxID=667725 RepID=A0A0L0FHR1_9EUKA|nr:hypothetical protein SARC_11173 [Sphaeroforma arctica JP610]KNC76319.1 hypothetical protein SARC_11173 [Sphaeroforma arctica JP610]|eukprot:XP_014150221.1 hypothetical protein SARC_11173 [Sphaeroforma arctica JP610]
MACPMNMTDAEYRELQIAAVSHNNGTTYAEVQLQAIATYYVSVFRSRSRCPEAGVLTCQILFSGPVSQKYLGNSNIRTISEVGALLIGLIVSLTQPQYMPLWIAVNIVFVLLSSQRRIVDVLSATDKKQEKAIVEHFSRKRKSFVTVYRSTMLVVVLFCILAVDFNIFERRFTKTETFGVSTMDTGVGAFILNNSIVTASRPQKGGLLRILKSSLPLVVLGLLRLLTVKSLDYQEHVSEYGVHWNFFFTLFFTGIVSNTVRALVKSTSALFMFGLAIATAYQWVLDNYGGEQYILEHPRSSIIHANKEGVCSIVGYTALYLMGCGIGGHLSKDRYTKRAWTIAFAELAGLTMTMWLALTWLVDAEPSRRMMNLPYIIWAFITTTSVLLLVFFVELFICDQPVKESKLMLAINRNQLFLFLLGNLLTGLVNQTTRTNCASDERAYTILIAYICILMGLALGLHKLKLTLKL